ncbi:MAG TPA: zinc-binding alcohol dehydrogenase family protein [Candidatus Cybelea sp.]|nr:zinc-binding alcohol dehydrogenase family protein [Candidatus Cybelea sp.]
MKAVQFEKPGILRMIEVSESPAPGPGEALVHVHNVGICGTDYGGFLGKMPFFSYPRIPGHELGVEVLAVGESVTNIKIGQRASIEPYLNCQHCYSCRCGHTNCCESNQTLGVHCDGGLRPQFLIPARKLHASGKLNFEQLALVEPLAIGSHAVDRGQPLPDEHVLIIGAGPIGLAAFEFARLSGAKTIVMDVNEARLESVRSRLRIPETIVARNDGTELKRLTELTNGQLADVVIDATGSDRSMSHALEYCAFGGRLVYVGITQNAVSFPHAAVMHRRELTILASRNALSGDFTKIIKLIEDGQLDTGPWITHRSDFDEMIQAFSSWINPETGVIKAMVHIAQPRR